MIFQKIESYPLAKGREGKTNSPTTEIKHERIMGFEVEINN